MKLPERQSRVYVKILITMIILAIVTSIYFCAFFVHYSAKIQREKIDVQNYQVLNQVKQSTENIFQLMRDNIYLSIWNTESLSLMTNPYYEERLMDEQILSKLSLLTSGNRLIRNLWLYMPYSDMVYSSIGTKIIREYSSIRETIDLYMNDLSGKDKEITWQIFENQGNLFLAVEIRLPQLVGVLLANIEKYELWMQVDSFLSNDYEEFIGIYNVNGTAINTWMDLRIDEVDLQGILEDDYNEEAYYRICSERTPWIYIMQRSVGCWENEKGRIYVAILPMLLMYILAAGLMIFFAIKEIYKPVYRLLKIASGEGTAFPMERPGKRKTEIDTIEEILESTVEENQKYGELLNRVYNDVVENIFRNIVLQRDYSMDSLREILGGFQRSDMLDGSFIVSVCQIYERKNQTSEIERNLYQKSLIEILRSAVQEDNSMDLFTFFTRTNLCCAIVSFREQMSANEMKGKIREIQIFVSDAVMNLPYSVRISSSRVCNKINSLSYAYKEAIDRLNDNQSEHEYDSGIEIKKYCQGRIGYIFETAKSGNSNAAITEFQTLVMEIQQKMKEKKDLAEALQFILITLQAQMESASQNVKEEVRNMAVCPELQAGLLEEEMVREVFAYANRLLSTVASFSVRRTSWYIDNAKAYIERNYQNGNLSLNDVSEEIGISGQYFSSMFSEATGTSFVSYLNEYRITRAKELLVNTDKTIQEIGIECGFNSVQSFCRVFKKHTGIPPGYYRKEGNIQ